MGKTKTGYVLSIAGTVLGMCLLAGMIETASAQDYVLTLYSGRVTEDKWFESLPPGVNFADAYIVTGAIARPVKDLNDGDITLEIEVQMVRHYGDQDHWEFNIPVAIRRHGFSWDDTVNTTMAFGLGPSWASQEPVVETEINGSTQKFLVYWFAEITLGPPASSWAFAFRLHHRSKAFGLVADDGGSNTLAAGLRFQL